MARSSFYVALAALCARGAALDLVRAPAGSSTRGAVAAWHATRKNEISAKLGAEAVAALEAPTPVRTLGALAGANALNIFLATQTPQLGGLWWVAAAATVGAWCSLAQFALLHDVVHGGADDVRRPVGERRAFRETVLKFGSQPSVFGYWLYLALGHLNHHAATGDFTARELFASAEVGFEDGDLFFASHRQESPGGADDDPNIISIARTFYRNLWRNDGSDGAALGNAAAYAASMALERSALCFNDKVVALTGSNRIFFPNKPDAFHDACADYARFAAAVQFAVLALAHFDPAALAYLLVAETCWQLPPWPAAALFVSNHGVHDDETGVGGADPGRPTYSVYGDDWFDALCFAANYHTEHHDFPKVPLWRLGELKRLAGPDFYPPSPSWSDVLDAAFRTKVTYAKWRRPDRAAPASRAAPALAPALFSPEPPWA